MTESRESKVKGRQIQQIKYDTIPCVTTDRPDDDPTPKAQLTSLQAHDGRHTMFRPYFLLLLSLSTPHPSNTNKSSSSPPPTCPALTTGPLNGLNVPAAPPSLSLPLTTPAQLLPAGPFPPLTCLPPIPGRATEPERGEPLAVAPRMECPLAAAAPGDIPIQSLSEGCWWCCCCCCCP